MNADPLARCYRWLEYAAFGRQLERHRFRYLDRLASARRILVLGEGDGRALARLAAIAPHACIDVIDSSARMIAFAQRRAAASGRQIRYFHQDARTSSWPGAHYDGVLTCFFLDCFDEPELRNLIPRVARSLRPHGTWVVSDFAIPSSGWRMWRAKAWVATMYFFFGLTTRLAVRTLPPISRLMGEAGLTPSDLYESSHGLIFSGVWRKAP